MVLIWPFIKCALVAPHTEKAIIVAETIPRTKLLLSFMLCFWVLMLQDVANYVTGLASWFSHNNEQQLASILAKQQQTIKR